VKDGRSITSTMGFTAVDGLMMGTRCGSIDLSTRSSFPRLKISTAKPSGSSAPPAKGRVALFVGVECDHVGRESAGRRATRDPPGTGLGGVVENVKAHA
jgi:hypothetical protein